ncbi:MAG: ankyrin repeat domain-containing protein [Synergistaceae bacterium]|nr:ankyrin repeat domain-containing protein [Synergistaceae bacterium]
MRRFGVVVSLAILVLALLSFSVAAFSIGTAAGTANRIINVTNAREFLEAIGSDRIIEMAPGKYNLSEWDPILNNQSEQAPRCPNLKNDGSPKLDKGVLWSDDPFDGGELVLSGINNLTIRSTGKASETLIIVDPRYAFVMTFWDCSDITMENLTAGHSEGGACEGGVFRFGNCSQIAINNAGMYGCGTVGLELSGVCDMKVTNSRIYECTYSIMKVAGGETVAFENCVFSDNEQFELIEIDSTPNVSFTNCEFTGNHGYIMFSVGATDISVSNSNFSGNSMDSPITESQGVDFVNCVISDDDVMTVSRFLRYCQQGSLQQVLDAIEGGANVNARDEHGWTPLLTSVANNRDPLVSNALIQAGANVNASNQGWTALMRAVAFGHSPEITDMLIKAGADVHAKNEYGKTALDYAGGNEKIIGLLTNAAAGKIINAMTDSDFVDLCAEGSLEKIVEAVKKGANVNARNEYGLSALMSAMVREENADPEVIKALIEGGADINVRHNDGSTPIMTAAALCRPEVIAAFIKGGVTANANDNNGRNALMSAAQSNPDPEAITVLIKAGVRVNTKDDNGQTALMSAARWNINPEVIKALLDNGADALDKDNGGKTALDYASENENKKIAELLNHPGASLIPSPEGNGDEKTEGEIRLKDNNTGKTNTLYPPFSEEDKGLLFYNNDRFGYSVMIPDIFTVAVLLPEDGDGIILGSADGKATFRVSGGFVMDKDQLQTSMEAAKKYAEENTVYANHG